MDNYNFNLEDIESQMKYLIEIEEEEDNSFEVAGTWGSVGTFGSSVGGCASSAGTASSAS
ncbi:thiocillin family RiPP [Staphylococcus epidermidis]|uniref:thiocillin family RiPP n=1 Tax=Staphylococcus epidermidis TaxID=1282 RepID=UPI00192996FC|nr:thiocillin family RiPP [Staphylococcus epidermidis]MCD8887125.1 thiocillin family RiPP [Staphylococcus epidermidis]MCG1130053.1 thiocillin family RiPP [Staphylococcus epidermidis]MCG1263363.1 thiocillin family RiPP [Staphylococcus epidermidis]MCG1303488.1 thiocillin family RiPP [Staphylococcus epidermidis]MCG1361472.1 thiocillin family RiPP [Staphylococcus epidermidis]